MKSKILNVDEIPEVEISTADTVPVLAKRKYLVNEKIGHPVQCLKPPTPVLITVAFDLKKYTS